MPQSHQTGPAFGKAASFISDVQLRHTLSPDKTQNSILFDNFLVMLLPGGPPLEMRTLSIAFPLTGVTVQTPLIGTVRGSVTLTGGVGAALALRVLGVTHLLDPLVGSDASASGDFVKELRLVVPPNTDLAMTFVLILERTAGQPSGEGLLTVDSVDIALVAGGASK